jgi:hypothetical protein
MTWVLRFGLVALLVVASATGVIAWPQQTPDPTEQEGYEFVSGTVEDLPAGKIVVNRAVLGNPPEIRTFTITADTKIEGDLKPGVRVTVGFKPSEEREPVAVRIIVRPQNSKSP